MGDIAEFVDAVARVGSGGTALDPEVITEIVEASRHRGASRSGSTAK